MIVRDIKQLLETWKRDPLSTYNSWFLWSDRLKNFRSIRRGLTTVIEEISSERFGSSYKGSSLEIVMKSITEQRQMFKGADHAFQWKPRMRIPDIYESRENQSEFGIFLRTCVDCRTEEAILNAVRRLEGKGIKGLGPAAANLLYFLHPTIVPAFNTAIVGGYNSITGSKVKLGKWNEFMAMRAGILRMNDIHRDLLSNDLGAICAFLYDVGSGRIEMTDVPSSEEATAAWKADLAHVRDQTAKRRKQLETDGGSEKTHSLIQGWLRDLGLNLGFDVWIASNDRSRQFGEGVLGDGCLKSLDLGDSKDADGIKLIDVLWIKKASDEIIAAFEVEHTTSIYSGILRLSDLALAAAGSSLKGVYLVAPDAREEDVRRQLSRPAFQKITELKFRFLAYSDFEMNRDAMSKFGEGLKAIESVSRVL